MKVLAYGGRDLDDAVLVVKALDAIELTVIIDGGARCRSPVTRQDKSSTATTSPQWETSKKLQPRSTGPQGFNRSGLPLEKATTIP